MPAEFTIALQTYFDFGPPFTYYELFVVRNADAGSSLERILLTPQGNRCWNAPTTETANATLAEPVSQLLNNKNPCAIPEKELRKEKHRCKHCLRFSGEDVVMQVQCGAESRLIRVDVLDADLFSASPNPPEHTAQTTDLLSKLDKASGPGVMEKPALGLSDRAPESSPIPDDSVLKDLAAGKYDSLFGAGSDKVSQLYLSSQAAVPKPEARIVSTMPVDPVHVDLDLGALDKLLILNDRVTVTFNVDRSGKPENVVILSGNPNSATIARRLVVRGEQFAVDAAGTSIAQTIDFSTNCPEGAKDGSSDRSR